MGRGNQYTQLVKVLYYKLPTINEKLPSFPHRVRSLKPPTLEVGGECVTTAPCHNVLSTVYIITWKDIIKYKFTKISKRHLVRAKSHMYPK